MKVIIRSWDDLLKLIEAECQLLCEDEDPSPNGDDEDGQESGLAGGGRDGDGPSLD